MIDLKIKMPGLDLKNPIMPASGTFGFGEEYAELYDLDLLGAIVTKATTLNPRLGNDTPRIAETYGGMLNAIGLQNPGIELVIKNKLSFLSKYKTPIIVNIAGSDIDEYIEVAKKISKVSCVSAIELNISCPNVKEGGIAFGSNADLVYKITKSVKEVSIVPVYVKLSPNVTDIVAMAIAAEKGGADGLSLINTLIGMRIDLKTGRPIIKNKTGGLSGPAIKPVAIRMVYQIYKNVKIPIIGIGGIRTAEDVLEFLFAGASAVQIGTMNLVNPYICPEIIKELPEALKKYNFTSITECIGYSHRLEK